MTSPGLLLASVILLGIVTTPCRAVPPTLEHLYPAGAAPGTSNAVSATGKFTNWPPRIWVSGSGVNAIPSTNSGGLSIEVQPGAEPGPRWLRLFNHDGASEPRLFVVGSHPEIRDIETNNWFAQPQWIDSIPVTVNGRLDKSGDVDSFGLRLKAGQPLVASLDAYTLMSRMDGLLRLVTTNGLPCAWNHDDATLDPRLVWQAPSNGPYVLQVMGFVYPANSDIRLAGGDSCVYRLHIDTQETSPPSSSPATTEVEPNDAPDRAQDAAIPSIVDGTVGRPGDVDRFRFIAKPGEYLEFKLEAASLGSPLDAWLKIKDASGKELAMVDDADGGNDPRIEWKAVPGTNTVVVGSLLRKGGEAYRYRLILRRLAPDFDIASGASSAVLSAGQTNEFKCTFRRLRGFDHKVDVSLRGLPDGVTAAPVPAPGTDGDVTLKLVASADAKAFSGPARIIATDSQTGTQRSVPFRLVSTSTDNGVPGGFTQLLRNEIEEVWLTVKAPPPPKPSP